MVNGLKTSKVLSLILLGNMVPLPNWTNYFQPLDLLVNKSAKVFLGNNAQEWYSERITEQMKSGKQPHDTWVTRYYDTSEIKAGYCKKCLQNSWITPNVKLDMFAFILQEYIRTEHKIMRWFSSSFWCLSALKNSFLCRYAKIRGALRKIIGARKLNEVKRRENKSYVKMYVVQSYFKKYCIVGESPPGLLWLS